MIRYQVEIGTSNGGPVIAKQFVVLKPFISKGADLTGVDGLLEGVTDQEIVKEINAFNAKDAFNAFKSNDTSLIELSVKNDAIPTVRAQVIAFAFELAFEQVNTRQLSLKDMWLQCQYPPK